MTKQQILLVTAGCVALGSGAWYFGYYLPKQKKLNPTTSQNTTSQNTTQYSENEPFTEVEVFDAKNPLTDFYLDKVGTRYRLNFELANSITQPSGFINLYKDNRNTGDWTAHGRVVEKTDFLRELLDKNIYSLYRENPQKVLDYIKQADDYQKYFNSQNEFELYAQIQPTRPMIVRAENGKNYLVPILSDTGYKENKILLERI